MAFTKYKNLSCQDLKLFDDKLTVTKLMKVVTAESPDPSNITACLNQEVCLPLEPLSDIHIVPFHILNICGLLKVSFLEFFEVLLGCAEVKCHLDERTSKAPSPKQQACKTSPRTTNTSPVVVRSLLYTCSVPLWFLILKELNNIVGFSLQKEATASTHSSPVASSPKSVRSKQKEIITTIFVIAWNSGLTKHWFLLCRRNTTLL